MTNGSLNQAELRDRQARQLWASSQADRAIDAMERAFKYFERHGMTDRVAEVAMELGHFTNWFGRGDSEMWLERALEAMGDNKAQPRRANCLLNLAYANLTQGSLEQAHAYLTASEESLFAAPPEERAHYLSRVIMHAQVSGEFASAVAAYETFRYELTSPIGRRFPSDDIYGRVSQFHSLILGHSISQSTPSIELDSRSLPTNRSVISQKSLQSLLTISCIAVDSPTLQN